MAIFVKHCVFICSEAYSEPCQTSTVECFARIVNDFQHVTIFTKRSILDVLQGSEYTSEFGCRDFFQIS